ncbi:MAG: hypothetical protein Q8Q14_05995 [Gemmatimonadales bacterium]|nr:hypothetical protein [Gemmatimonadales bacterium]
MIGRWRDLLAVTVFVFAGLALLQCPGKAAGQPLTREGEAAAPLHVITLGTGKVTTEAHNEPLGYWNIGEGMALLVQPGAIPELHLRELRGKVIALEARVIHD